MGRWMKSAFQPGRCLLFCSLIIIGACRPPGIPPGSEEAGQVAAPNKVAKKQPDLAKRPDHLEAVPLERDGGLNKDFRQEILLGKDSSDFEIGADGVGKRHDDNKGKDTADLLEEMFKKADKNNDGQLNAQELEDKIVDNTIHHLDEGQNESKVIFQVIDQDGDQIITWDEYHYHFLVDNKLMDKEKAKKHDEQEHENMDEDKKFQIEDDKVAFDRADPDKNGLDDIEWLSFRHPEHSNVMLKDMADEILKALDKDGDGELSEDEFAAPAPGDVDESMLEAEKAYIEDRRKEFRSSIDTDASGKASAKELLEYVNPRNPLHAKQEVTEIMSIADENRDGLLTLDELLAQKELLERSGFIRPNARLHEDL
uniref:EF-hand domain-containing protein n=1 Tax=Plectus sambesii TaxID=2011161 RepID=A0A914WB37_9BILA